MLELFSPQSTLLEGAKLLPSATSSSASVTFSIALKKDGV